MKIIVSAAGRFHAYHLAGQLEKHGHLHSFFTTAPRSSSDGVPSEKVRGSFLLQILGFVERAWCFIPFLKSSFFIPWLKFKLFDSWVARQIKNSDSFDIFIGWNGHCLKSLKAAKDKGAICVVEKGIVHPDYVKEKMLEEYERLRIDSPVNKNAFEKKIRRRSLEELDLCDYIAVASGFVENSFLERGFPKEKIIKVPYGVELRDFKQVPKTDDIFRIVWCGYISVRKGIPYLLKAFKELDIENKELILLGYYDKELDKFMEWFADPGIKNLGPKFQKNLYKYYSQGSVFVHPSLIEGLSMVQLEAMACGLPLISTTNTGIQDVIKDGKEGFIIPIRSSKAIKAKLKYLYENPAIRKKMGLAAKKTAHKFTWDYYGARLIKKYQTIIGNKDSM